MVNVRAEVITGWSVVKPASPPHPVGGLVVNVVCQNEEGRLGRPASGICPRMNREPGETAEQWDARVTAKYQGAE